MGTRSIIKVEGIEFAEVYKHFDGYPEGMVGWLTKFNKDFAENRGDDPGYKFAQLLRTSQEEFDGKYTGRGVVPYNSDMGQEYTYTLHTDGTVTYQ